MNSTRPTVGAAASPHASAWIKPIVGNVKLNCDAGHIGIGGCGLGIVLRDEHGGVVAAGAF